MSKNPMQSTTVNIGEMERLLREKMIPFWLTRSVDAQYGGYLTSFDADGMFDGNDTKYIVTQCRMIWGFSHLSKYARPEDKAAMKAAAEQGYRFLSRHFWDQEHWGFRWQTNHDGSPADSAKLVYGESFAIYALSEYYLIYKEKSALQHAKCVFDLLQIYAADTLNGGYYENLEADWSRSPAGAYAGDRKSLDIHMHLMEAFTTLAQATGEEIHLRKLAEVVDVLYTYMVDRENGYGFNQFDARFHRLPAININRTWNAERESNESVSAPTDTTSYGHNIEFAWLLDRALSVLKCVDGKYIDLIRKLTEHTVTYGWDREYGGVYRDGVGTGSPLITDKEWWQNFEALPGFLNSYARFGDERYLQAFNSIWDFNKTYFIHPQLGESRQLLDREGRALVANLGNPWKGIYHTGRALAECFAMFPDIR